MRVPKVYQHRHCICRYRAKRSWIWAAASRWSVRESNSPTATTMSGIFSARPAPIEGSRACCKPGANWTPGTPMRPAALSRHCAPGPKKTTLSSLEISTHRAERPAWAHAAWAVQSPLNFNAACRITSASKRSCPCFSRSQRASLFDTSTLLRKRWMPLLALSAPECGPSWSIVIRM